MLHGGKIHDAFHADSPNRLLRNGVGVTTNGIVLFAISEAGQTKNPNLYEFAEFFRDNGCRDALYLDGVISQAIMGSHETLKTEHQFGAIFAVFESTGKKQP